MLPGARLHIHIYIDICRYVFTGTLQRLHWPLTATFPSGPAIIRSFTSIQMVHTHTLTLLEQPKQTLSRPCEASTNTRRIPHRAVPEKRWKNRTTTPTGVSIKMHLWVAERHGNLSKLMFKNAMAHCETHIPNFT